MELISALKMRQIGDEIEVLSSDKGSVTDIPEWCKKVKHECISVMRKRAIGASWFAKRSERNPK